jgi:protein tyrosine phosphatase (PTP) superfamily phosphohydrolase (DUF442 family)
VVLFPNLTARRNVFSALPSRATLDHTGNMKKFRLILFLPFVFISANSPHLSAQTQQQAAPVLHSAYGAKLRIPGIPNAGKINDHLYRGAQPRDSGVAELKKIGITTIVNLRQEDPTQIAAEQKTAESLGIRFVHIPVNGWSTPTDEQIAQFLGIFRDHPLEKVYLHCRYGDDRTGVFVATYRMAFEKLPPDQALKEMYFFGFNGPWHPEMAAFVREFPARLAGAPALAQFKNP